MKRAGKSKACNTGGRSVHVESVCVAQMDSNRYANNKKLFLAKVFVFSPSLELRRKNKRRKLSSYYYYCS